MKDILDEFILKFGIEASDLKNKISGVLGSLDELEKKSKKTGDRIEGNIKKGVKKSVGYDGAGLMAALGVTDKNQKKIKESTKQVNTLKNSVYGLNKTLLNAGRSFSSIFNPGTSALSAAAFAFYKMTQMVTNVAGQGTAMGFLAQSLSTPVNTLSAAGQALRLTGGNPANMGQALGTIGMAQTNTRFFGTSSLNPYLYSLGVPLANNNATAIKPLDILLDLSKKLTQDVSSKKMTKQDAYNLLAMMGFSSVANFIMQGPNEVLKQLKLQSTTIGALTQQQVLEFNKVTAASGAAANAMDGLGRKIAFDLSPAVIRFFNLVTKVADNLTTGGVSKNINALYVSTGAKDVSNALGNIFSSNLVTGSSLANVIKKGESSGSYNAINSGTYMNDGNIGYSSTKSNLTNMSIAQIISQQQNTKRLSSLNPNRLFAVGAYQFNPSTLLNLTKQMGISPSTIFSKQIQDKMYNYLLMQDAAPYITGKTTDPSMSINNLRRDWTSLDNQTNAQLTQLLNKARAQNFKAQQSAANNVKNNHVQAQTTIHAININAPNATDSLAISKSIKSNLTSYIPSIQALTGAF